MKTVTKDIEEFIDFLKKKNVSDIVDKSIKTANKSSLTSVYPALSEEEIKRIATNCLEHFFEIFEKKNSILQQEPFAVTKSLQLEAEFFRIGIEREQKNIITVFSTEFTSQKDEAKKIIIEIENYYDAQLSASLRRIQQASINTEIEVENLEKKLQKTEKESQHFAYAASHDLQEPLRMITSYLEILSNKYKDKLPAEASEFIEIAIDGSTRMKSLISSLLEFSRLSKQPELKKVNTNAILASVLEKMSSHVKESEAKITVGNLPEIFGNSDMIAKLFQQLILNAIKFKKGEPLKIDIHAQEQESAYRFSIADNGIGILKEYFEKIFIIFQRLHGKNKYPGTGIGLALCKKIVEQHGGQIWVESEINTGATFYFTIPMEAVLT